MVGRLHRAHHHGNLAIAITFFRKVDECGADFFHCWFQRKALSTRNLGAYFSFIWVFKPPTSKKHRDFEKAPFFHALKEKQHRKFGRLNG